MKRRPPRSSSTIAIVEVLERRALLSAAASHVASRPGEILNQLSETTPVTASTIPPNGDVNPYGLAFVPEGFARGGVLHTGDLLVSNFNASSNLQGTGTTIVRVTPDGKTSTFFQGAPGLGLTTALGVLRNGYVLVGNLPTTDGTGATAQQGSLLILDKNGTLVETLTSPTFLNGPWDLTIHDQVATAQVFVSNVLSGTVSRIDLKVPTDGSMPIVLSETQIASGYTHRTDVAALLLGPTGLAYNGITETLFVASTADNAIYAIPDASDRTTDAGTGKVIYTDPVHLHGPLGMVIAPNGDLIVANGDAINPDATHNGELVEFTEQGKFVSQFQVDSAAGSAFGVAIQLGDDNIRFAAVDDNTNSVSIWNLPVNDHDGDDEHGRRHHHHHHHGNNSDSNDV
jgi:hypothetical protein